jgi:hypothetical protein
VSSIKPHQDAGYVDGRQEIGGRLLVTAGDGSEAFDVMEEALHISAKAIEGARLAAAVVLSRGIHRDNGLHAPPPDRADDCVGVVPRICDESFSGRVLDQVLCFRRVVLLAGREDDVKRLPFAGGDRVELGRKTSSRAAQSIASDPPFPPAASWCARTTVPSMSEPTSSSIRSALKTCSQTPRLAHRAKRLYVVCQGPYRSGMSRQGAPVLSRHITALTNGRSPRWDRGPGWTGSRTFTCAHWASLSSCRCTRIVAHAPIPRAIFPSSAIEDTP